MTTTTTRSEDGLFETTVAFRRSFTWKDSPGAGFSFPCDESGKSDPDMNPAAAENWRKCTDGTYDVRDNGVQRYEHTVALCGCGSGEYPYPEYDARGIYLCRVCDQCRARRLAGYRPDVLTDSNYWADEPIEPEY